MIQFDFSHYHKVIGWEYVRDLFVILYTFVGGMIVLLPIALEKRELLENVEDLK